jgi:hypothetical protein
MPNPEIEEFAKLLVQNIRDKAIEACDENLQPAARHAIAQRWREAAPNETPDSVAKVIIPDIVDNTLFQLLSAIDNGQLKLSFTTSTGNVVNLTKEGLGELAGWYAGTTWIAQYSKERFVNDFPNLA